MQQENTIGMIISNNVQIFKKKFIKLPNWFVIIGVTSFKKKKASANNGVFKYQFCCSLSEYLKLPLSLYHAIS